MTIPDAVHCDAAFIVPAAGQCTATQQYRLHKGFFAPGVAYANPPWATVRPWADDLDVITIYYYNRFSDAERPALTELESAMDGFNRKQFDPLYAKYKKPLVFLLPFQSRDHAAAQQWFEPMANEPSVRQDLIAQADLYEAFFTSTADEPWYGGAITWGYWIEPGFSAKYSFEKSSSVRGKTAALVVQRWFAGINQT